MTYSSKKSFLSSKNVDKRFLVKYVSKKLNHSIAAYHITAVINFLFDEIILELKNRKSIIIGKFGKFIMKKLANRQHHDIVSKMVITSEGNNVLRLQLDKNMQEILTDNLDIAKTFEEPQDG